MALSVQFTRVSPMYPQGFYVQWTLRSVDQAASGAYAFTLERSGGPSGPWEPVMSATDTYAHWDKFDQPAGTTYATHRRPNQFAFGRSYYYRVRVVAPNGVTAEYVDDTEPGLDPKQAQYWRKADYDLRKGLRFTGTPAAVFKKRRWGERCPKCTSKVTRDPLRGACVNCFGTGFVRGYYEPVLLNLRRGAPQGTSQQTPEGRQDSNGVKITAPSTPGLEPGDLIVFLRDNRRFEVDQQIETQITLVTVHQTVQAMELGHDHVAYRLRVDKTSLNPIL